MSEYKLTDERKKQIRRENLQVERENLVVCRNCKKEVPKEGTLMCEECLETMRQRTEARRMQLKSKGLCERCGKVPARDGRVTCDECSKKKKICDKESIKRTIDRGVCIICRKEKATAGQKCVKCCVKNLAHIHGISAKDLWEKIEKQNWACCYSGRQLKPAVNFSVEHIKSRYRHGDNAHRLDNIAVADCDVNKMKGGFEKNEFLQMVKEVYEYLKLDKWGI